MSEQLKESLSAVIDGEYAAHKSWAVGEPESIPPANIRGPREEADLDDRPDTGSTVAKEMTRTMREMAALRQGQDFIGEMEGRALEREVKPAQMMMQMMGTMMETLKKPAPDSSGQIIALILPMITQMMTMQQTVFLEMLKQRESKGDRGEGLRQVAESLTLLEKTLTGRIGEMLDSRTDGEGKSVDWATVAQIAAPILERGMGILEAGMRQRAQMPPRPAIVRPISVPSQPGLAEIAPPTDTPHEGADMRLHPDPDMDAALKEAAKMGVELLKSKDFEGLYALIDLNFPELLEKINPSVAQRQPGIYMQFFKRLHPDYDKLREEFVGFCEWMERNAPEEPEAEIGTARE